MLSVTRLVVAVVFALLAVAPAAVVSAAPAGALNSASVVAAQPPPAPDPTAPPGVDISPEQESDRAKDKLVIGVITVVLLGIVILGRNAHNKRRKAAEG